MYKYMYPLIIALLFSIVTTNSFAIKWDDNGSLLKTMVLRVTEKFDDINNNVDFKDTLDEAATQLKKTLKENRPEGDFLGKCDGECAVFKDEMLTLLGDIEETNNILRSMGESKPEIDISYKKLKTAIGFAPGPVLFPMYVAFNKSGLFSGLTERMKDLPDALNVVKSHLDKPGCQRYYENSDLWRKSTKIVLISGIALKLAGKGLLAIGETNMMAKKKIGIHGYAGVIVEDNKKKRLGQLIDGLSSALLAYASKLDRSIYRCDIFTALAKHDQEIKKKVDIHDTDVKILLHEIIRLQLTPPGRRESSLLSFPLKPNKTVNPE